jgi:NADPH-dependent FMN reductase
MSISHVTDTGVSGWFELWWRSRDLRKPSRDTCRGRLTTPDPQERRKARAMPLDLLIVYGSVRRDRQGIRAARFILEACRGRGHQATLVDPAVDQLPLLDRMYKEYQAGHAPEVLERLAGLIKATDAFIIVSGEYNHITSARNILTNHPLTMTHTGRWGVRSSSGHAREDEATSA